MSADLWNEAELVGMLGGPSASLASAVTGVSIDTRTLEAGDLFFALRGDTHDGPDHVERAPRVRARANELQSHGPVFGVDDTLRAMERLGQAARARSSARIAAVTGSVGKT